MSVSSPHTLSGTLESSTYNFVIISDVLIFISARRKGSGSCEHSLPVLTQINETVDNSEVGFCLSFLLDN